MIQHGTGFSTGEIIVLLAAESLVQNCKTPMFVLCDDHVCNPCNMFV